MSHPQKSDNDFFDAKSIDRLAAEQGVDLVANLELLAGALPPDDGLDEMLAEIYAARRSPSGS